MRNPQTAQPRHHPMRLTPREPEIGPDDGFTEANDLFGYADFGERFASLVGRIDEPLVIVLDGPWGSGKSVFAKQWAGLLRQRGAPVIEFDAFANDFYEDAFVALSAQVYAKAKERLGANQNVVRRYYNNSKKVGKALTPLVLRVGTRLVTLGILSLEDLEAGNEVAREVVKTLGAESGKAIENAISERLRASATHSDQMEAFRETLSELSAALAGEPDENGKRHPLVFIIDELDRCRPPFALSVIERIKHLFSVEGVCFVLVTHLHQLETAVRGAYGAEVDAGTYLQKFYHLPVRLPAPSSDQETRRAKYIQHVWKSLGISFADQFDGGRVMKCFNELADAHDLSLRELRHVMTNVALASGCTGPNHYIIAPILAGLCVMRLKRPELYQRAQVGTLEWQEAYTFLTGSSDVDSSKPDSTIINVDWSIGYWAYCLGADLAPELKDDHRQSTHPHYRTRPAELVGLMCGYIDDFALEEFKKNTT